MTPQERLPFIAPLSERQKHRAQIAREAVHEANEARRLHGASKDLDTRACLLVGRAVADSAEVAA